MVLLCSGHRDSWPREYPAGVMDIPCLSRCERLVDAEEPEADMFGIDVLVTEGRNLDTCHHAGYRTTRECMQGAGPKVPGIGSAVAEGMQSHQRAAPSLRTGYC